VPSSEPNPKVEEEDSDEYTKADESMRASKKIP
jgi:hypothetical protein